MKDLSKYTLEKLNLMHKVAEPSPMHDCIAEEIAKRVKQDVA